MPYRISFEFDERAQRFFLKPGENLIGTLESSDIAVIHPSISRSHCVFVVTADRVQLADLGSANGTFVNGERIHSVTDASTNDAILLGSVPVELEHIAEADAQATPVVAATVESTAAPSQGQSQNTELSGRRAKTTASTHPIHLLSLRLLPDLTKSLGEGRSLSDLTHTLGKAVFDLFPTDSISVCHRSGGDLFRADRKTQEGSDGDWDRESTSEQICVGSSTLQLEVYSQRPASLQMARPLLQSALELIEHSAADTRGAARTRDTAESHAAAPPTQGLRLTSLDPVMSKLLDQGAKIAVGDVSVLVLGESGTGKEVFANYLHQHSGREPLVTLNCAALPTDLLEAELFGIESGVATGVKARAGKFEQAHGGTLFLDEIGDMSSAVQAKVLRVLETGEVARLGASTNKPARARLIAATNRDLSSMVSEGEFRLDLYHRIADWEVTLPPLRERQADLPNLISLFLEQEASARGIRVGGISKQVLTLFQRHSWPGNIRELQREIKRAVLLLADGDLLDEQSLSQRVRPVEPEATGLEHRLRLAERTELERALIAHDGQASAAAAALEVPLSSFYRKLKAHGLKDQ